MKTETVICYANQKGGVAKTTSCINTASALTKRGKNVLVVDMDPQANATRGMGLDPNADSEEDKMNLYELFRAVAAGEPCDAHDAIAVTERGDVLKGSGDLFLAESDFIATPGREHMLRKLLEGIKSEYDYILVDTGPNLGWGVLNGLTASNYVIVPCSPNLWSNEGILRLGKTINLIKEFCNPNLQVLGILITNSEGSTNAAKRNIELTATIGEASGVEVFETVIPHGTKANDANTDSVDLLTAAPLSKPAIAYGAFADELLKKVA